MWRQRAVSSTEVGAEAEHALLAVEVAQQREPEGEDLQAVEGAAWERVVQVERDVLDEVRLGRREVEPPPLHRRLLRRVLEPVMELRVGELHHGIDGLRAQVDVVVGEAVGQRAQPPLLDERAHQRPVLHVLHV